MDPELVQDYEDEEEELILCDLEETAKNVAFNCLEADSAEEFVLCDLEQTAYAVALRVF